MYTGNAALSGPKIDNTPHGSKPSDQFIIFPPQPSRPAKKNQFCARTEYVYQAEA